MSIEMILAALSALVAVVVAAFSRGKATGKKREQAERAAELNKRAVDAWKQLNEVKNETASKDDDAVSAELKSKWVRK